MGIPHNTYAMEAVATISEAGYPTRIQSGINRILRDAGIEVNGQHPWDVTIRSPHIYSRIVKDGLMGAGEGYMAGEWDCDDIPELIYRLMMSHLEEQMNRPLTRLFTSMSGVLTWVQQKNPFAVADKHYNLPHQLFEAMLDTRMVYTCAYWDTGATTLDDAQEAKLVLVCRKIGLQKGMRVLDIGGGWGSFAKYAAQKYGVSVVNVTVSKEQVMLANKLCKGLPVENRLQDYHEIADGPYDRIVSLGMFEHVRRENYRDFMRIAASNLADNGIFLLHTIGCDVTTKQEPSWVTKYIFPNSEVPNASLITTAFENLFVIEDWHNVSTNYEKTLLAWFDRFDHHWGGLKRLFATNGRDPHVFYRMWKLYLLGCAGMFRARRLQLWQIVLSKNGVRGGYKRVA